jgi:uncharacterized membrane protein
MTDPTTLHLLAVAATVLGATGTLSIVVCRTAMRWLVVGLVPTHLMARVRWWRSHAVPALHTSTTVMVLGLVGLLIS